MPAQPKIPSAQIEMAIREWGGNVSAAAEALGMHPKNLRERLVRLGVDLQSIRTGTYGTSRDVAGRTGTHGTVSNVSHGTHGPKSAPRTVTVGRRVSIVPAMQAAVAAKDDSESGSVRASGAPPKPVRTKPGFLEGLRQAKVAIIGRLGIDTDEQLIYEQFCEEAFDPWLRSKLEPVAKTKTPKNGDREKGCDRR